MMDQTQPFWRLRKGGDSRKLDAGQEFIWQKCPGTRPGQSLYPLRHIRWAVHYSLSTFLDALARYRVEAEV